MEESSETPVVSGEVDSVEGDGVLAQTQVTPDPNPLRSGPTHHPSVRIEDLDPPRTRREIARDHVLTWVDGRCFQVLGLVAFVLVIADGAFFFFLLMGWQAMCVPRTDCEPRNWWYNWSVQVLTGLFTYTALVSLPWRWANCTHTLGFGCRDNTPGHDLYGLPTKDVWFHFPLRIRLKIIVVLLLNIFCQLANQATRIIFPTYELQDEFPANVWVTVFFMLSLLFAGVGFFWMIWEGYSLRKADPEFFRDGGGPTDIVIAAMKKHCCRMCGGEVEEQEAEEEVELDSEELQYEHEDPTSNPVAVIFGSRRGALRLWGM